ncbi:hypothetical protein [uncultured Arthrobacter sp.]|nr:hypothetical protein [uncultured Arthrobacter sp.]
METELANDDDGGCLHRAKRQSCVGEDGDITVVGQAGNGRSGLVTPGG